MEEFNFLWNFQLRLDVRCANEFKVFTNINSAVVDPKSFDETGFVDLNSEVCVIPPNSFVLAKGR
ncbi:MAG: hypothetical protein Ct9H300mP4_12030 [Gammaproteobacteria bacterium]|nr:MAG: hypothetical protein Ct9H300mP4_12030 [Gammaproteobacteria bacterium]